MRRLLSRNWALAIGVPPGSRPRIDASGSSVTLALPQVGSRADAERWRAQISESLAELVAQFGPRLGPQVTPCAGSLPSSSRQ